MTSWSTYGDKDRGPYQQSWAVEMTVQEALDQSLLGQVIEHSTSGCSDDKVLTMEFGRGPRLVDMDDYANCPRCFLLQARDDRPNGLMRVSKLRLRVVVQIKKATFFNNIIWD
jgi:hypothetical protein